MIEQGYPGGPRPEGAHRAVICTNCGQPEARRTLIRRINDKLTEAMSTPGWERAWREALRKDPELTERLRRHLSV